MNEFYKNIEKPMRGIVRLLRDNGFNTCCSCGHTMTIDLKLGNHIEDVERIATFLIEEGYKGFKIECTLHVPSDGFWERRATIHFSGWM